MLDRDTVIRHPAEAIRRKGQARAEVLDPRTSVTMKDRGLEVVLFFDDLSGEGPLREVRVLPDKESMGPYEFRRLIPQAPLYVNYARAALAHNQEDVLAALSALREVGATRRGLGQDFYKIVASNYETLMSEGERYPVKALAAMHHVSISAASRWLKEARRRGLLPEKVSA